MKFHIDHKSNVPLYSQIIEEIKKAVKNETLKNGDVLPSLSEFAEENGVSMETTKKAYNLLKKEGVLSGRQGKGYFIDIRKGDAPLRILMLLDKLSAYKLAIHRGLSESLDSPADITINIHNQDITMFGKMVADSLEKYDYYIIAAHFPRDVKPSAVAKILKRIPNDRLILIDVNVPEAKGRIGRIYQDFRTDASEALEKRPDLIRKYSRAVIIESKLSLYGNIICPNIKKMLSANGLKCTVEKEFKPDLMEPGTLFIVLGGQIDTCHFGILREAMDRGYCFGRTIGLVFYNDEPVNEFICGGITCISSDFGQMGRNAAEMINTGKLYSIHNPFNLILRTSL